MIRRSAVLLFTLSVCLAATAQTAPPAPATDWSELRRVVADELTQHQMPGASVAVVADDRIVFAEGFGLADVKKQLAVTSDTRFRIGSVTKMLTATATLSLATAPNARLDLHAPIRTYVPTLPPKLGALTLDQLLAHRAGLVDRLNDDDPNDTDLFLDPGTRFSYSSLGYSLIGRVLSAVTGQPFERVLAQTVFDPYAMRATGYDEGATPAAIGYRVRNGKPVRAAVMDDARYRPAGFLLSTAPDLARFAIAFMSGALPPRVVAELSQPRSDLPGDPRRYGYGTFTLQEGENVAVFHMGDERGGSAYVKMIPARHCAVVVLTNRAGRLPKTMAAALRLAAGIAPQPEEPKPAAKPLTRDDAAMLAGTYMNFSGLTIRRRGDTAILKPWLPWFLSWLPMSRPIVKYADDRYGISGTTVGREPLKVIVLRDGGGRVDALFVQGRVYKRQR